MSTGSVTVFAEQGCVCAVMYRHADGHPACHGAALRDFLMRCTSLSGDAGGDEHEEWVSAFDDADGPFTATGISCLAAQVVAHFKDGPGHIYLKPEHSDWSEEFRYIVYATKDHAIGLEVQRMTVVPDFKRFGLMKRGRITLYKGSVKDFDPQKAAHAALSIGRPSVRVVDTSGSMLDAPPEHS
ncbi:MAG: hypothetical protein PVI86_09215 [Phycisphaerae bacterium]|jgi:hypothetical protein